MNPREPLLARARNPISHFPVLLLARAGGWAGKIFPRTPSSELSAPFAISPFHFSLPLFPQKRRILSRGYNHGQKSWDTFPFLGRYPIHTGPTPPLTPQTMLDVCIRNFFRFSTLYWVGGELQECTVLRGNREMTEKYEYCSTVPRTFVQDCSYNVAPLAGFSQSKKRVLYPQRPFLLSMMSFLSERSCDSQSEVRFQKESNSW